MTNINLDLNFYRFNNVVLVKTDKDWSAFREFELINHIFKNTNETIVYKLDLDARVFDFREEKYDKTKFAELLNRLEYDVLYSWGLGNAVNVAWHLRPPEQGENKDTRNYTYGHEEVITYLKNKLPDYDKLLERETYLESVLIFKKSDKVISFLDEVITLGNIIEKCDKNINRKHWAHCGGFVLSLFTEHYNINFVKSDITYHYMKPNFLTEVFLWGWNMEPTRKIYS